MQRRERGFTGRPTRGVRSQLYNSFMKKSTQEGYSISLRLGFCICKMGKTQDCKGNVHAKYMAQIQYSVNSTMFSSFPTSRLTPLRRICLIK